MAKDSLARYNQDPWDFEARVVKGDETWIYYWKSESKTRQWKHKTSPTPQKVKSARSAYKVMATFFWNSEGIIMVDYLPHGETITGAYYAALLRQLREAIKEKGGEIKKRSVAIVR